MWVQTRIGFQIHILTKKIVFHLYEKKEMKGGRLKQTFVIFLKNSPLHDYEIYKMTINFEMLKNTTSEMS